jgi:hypothetical protein
MEDAALLDATDDPPDWAEAITGINARTAIAKNFFIIPIP